VIDHGDELIDAIADVLRPLPRVDDTAKARVLIAIAAQREREREASRRRTTWRRSYAWVVAAGAAAAAVFFAVLASEAPPTDAKLASQPAEAAAPAATRLAASTPNAETLVPVQLVFRAPAAARVRVVGDFNEWDKERLPMTRDPETGLWSVTLTLRPGRHVYAFVVDDSIWVRDPRAVSAPDADFGRPGSVLLVGQP
jgi:hypothetical protein